MEKNKDMQDIYSLAFHTGMRLNEILNLKLDAVDLPRGEIFIRNTNTFTTKNKYDQGIPLNRTLEASLIIRFVALQVEGNNRYLFQTALDVPYKSNYVSKRFKRACPAAGINNAIHFHSLRHS